MSEATEIQQAVERLTEFKENSTPGPWLAEFVDEPTIYTMGDTVMGGTIAYINADQQTGDHHPAGDADLIVILHATIDTQLAILADALVLATRGHSKSIGHGLTLARAINGASL